MMAMPRQLLISQLLLLAASLVEADGNAPYMEGTKLADDLLSDVEEAGLSGKR